ncbi:MAG: CysB family transcriptional regulator [Rhodanobacter sp. 68-29]|nr:LysR family transcriptional regulator [Rhodanobacter sp.]ODV27821.1 MAG: CysB family transcriptional regulator [Rhodanobacter sp. SCN 68-63]OJY61331.1 MAG: CysB family transcriptional regulator [Rhodanobacter sp. 68-29]
MTLTQLRYLVAIADCRLNITAAAEHVHATQPGVSKQLKQLEDELGLQLFSRKGKSLDAITDAGVQVIERARVILAEALNIRSIAANLRNEAHGELRIATTHTQARFALPASIAALNRRYPQVSVHLQPCGDAEVLDLLEGGRVDLAVVSTSGAAPAGGIALPAYRWSRVVLVPKSHPLATLGREPTLEELAAQPLVSYDSSKRPESSLRRAFATAGLVPQIAMTAADADLIKTYVRAGMGIGVLAEMALQPGEDADLRVIQADALLPLCTTWIVLRKDSVLRDYTLEWIAQFAPHLDRNDVRRLLTLGIVPETPPRVPHWREREGATAKRAAAATPLTAVRGGRTRA